MTYSYFYIPNSLIETKMLASDLSVAIYLYSVGQAYGNQNLLGLTAKARQQTIASACKMSVEGVSRAVKRLQERGIIIAKERRINRKGHLGTYTYTLKAIAGKYFRMCRSVAKLLEPKELRIYALMCKLKGSVSNMFYHSYSDLAKMIGIGRSEIIKLIKCLIDLNVIHRLHQRTRQGDFGENRYYIFKRVKGFIKRRRNVPSIRSFQKELNQYTRTDTINSTASLSYIYHIFLHLSSGKRRKMAVFLFYIRGGVRSDGSYVIPTYIFICPKKKLWIIYTKLLI
ncbi:MAG: helix-turn-helix domain-containing protein [Ruminococcus sp.]|nr:helix-turn-helix domain-containing protein [Ruminococcus sp.]